MSLLDAQFRKQTLLLVPVLVCFCLEGKWPHVNC